MKLSELVNQLRSALRNCGDIEVLLHSPNDYSPSGEPLDYSVKKIHISGYPTPTKLIIYPYIPPFTPLS